MSRHWNYRIMRHQNILPAEGRLPETTEIVYALHSVHYDSHDDSTPTDWSTEPAQLYSESRTFEWILDKFAEALAKPTLDYETGLVVHED